MKKLLLFPYHPDIELLAEKSDMLQGVSIAGVHSFREDLAAVAAVPLMTPAKNPAMAPSPSAAAS